MSDALWEEGWNSDEALNHVSYLSINYWSGRARVLPTVLPNPCHQAAIGKFRRAARFRSALHPLPYHRYHGDNKEGLMPQTTALSDAAQALLRRHAEHGELPVNDSNRELHRELARAGLMVAVHTFTGGREQFYRFTREGWDFARSMSTG